MSFPIIPGQSERERLNAEILYWMNETDKRKVQLGEYLLDSPCDPDDSLWERLAAREVASARERIAADPLAAMGIIMELVRDKQECLVSVYVWVYWYSKLTFIPQLRLKSRDDTISRLASIREALEASRTEMEKSLHAQSTQRSWPQSS